jgi:hypothetical protein
MAGFKRKKKIYKLDFEGTEYDGLEVKVGGLTTGEFLELIGLSAPGTEESNETEKMMQFFSAHLVSWNLEDENDEPVPATFDGVKTNELAMNQFIVSSWISALADVPEATEKKSSGGETPLMDSIPTETLL